MKVFNRGIEILDVDIKCLENDLLNVEEWIEGAIAGKINNCKKRMIREWYPRLLADTSIQTVPADEDALVNFIIGHKDYQNRYQREELITAEPT